MSTNDITGDKIKTKPPTDQYKTNYDRIRWNSVNDNRAKEFIKVMEALKS